MKRRYSPQARRAHLAHLRAKYGKQQTLKPPPFEETTLGFVSCGPTWAFADEQPEPRKCGLGWCHNEALDGYAVCAEHLPQQPEPAPKPEQPIDCDCIRCQEERRAALPEQKINFYGVPPCGHFLLYLPESQANEQHFCYKCQKLVAMESEADHLQHVRQAEQERQERIKACAAALAALQPEPAPKPPEAKCYRCNRETVPGFRRWDDFRSGWLCAACAGIQPPTPPTTPAAEKPSWFHTIEATVDDAGEMHLTVDGQPEPAPMPPTVQYTEYKHLYCEDCGKSICFVPLNDTGHYYFCRSCQRNVRVIEDVAPLSPAEQKEAESADNWAKTIDPPSPPWEVA